MSATNPPTLQGASPGKLRRELETLVINDLLGPAAGPVEEVDELAGATVRRLLNLYQAPLIHQIQA